MRNRKTDSVSSLKEVSQRSDKRARRRQGETVRHASMRANKIAATADRVLREKCVSEHDGRRSGSLQLSSLTGVSETDLHSRVLFPGGAGDGARERDRNVRGGNRRNGKGSSSSQSAGGHEFRQRGIGPSNRATESSSRQRAFELRTAEGMSTEAGNG
jgi:hypothetical protein